MKRSKLSLRLVSIIPRLCTHHRAAANPPTISCEPNVCVAMTRAEEHPEMLHAIYLLAEDLVNHHGGEPGEGEQETILGTPLASALTIQALAVQVQSELTNPMWVPDPLTDGESS